MKKLITLMLTFSLLLLCVQPVLAEAETLTQVRITYGADAILSASESIAAQVVLVDAGQETALDAQLSLVGWTSDMVAACLPQQNLRGDSGDASFTLYNNGGDARYTKSMSALCSALIGQTPVAVPVRSQEPVEVSLNGEYWGLYTKYETIEAAIIRFEGLDSADSLNIADANGNTVFGDASGLKEALQRIEALDLSAEADQQILSGLLDTDSFLNWLAVNAYFGNANLFGDLYFYQVGDSAWKCAAGDFAFAFQKAADNTIARLLKQENSTNAALSAKLLGEARYRDVFLTKLGAVYQALPTDVMQQALNAANARIADALPAHMARWTQAFADALGTEFGYTITDAQEALCYQSYRVYVLRDKTLVKRPWYLYDSVQTELNVSDEDMAAYFGEARPELPDVPGDSWEEYKAANL